MIYFVSDTHFNHAKLTKLCPIHFDETRSYDTVEEMNTHIIKVWNETVKPEDQVIFLGDFMLNVQKTDYLAEFNRMNSILNGEKIFILGNHDDKMVKTCPDIAKYEKYTFKYGDLIYRCQHQPFIKENMRIGDVYVHGHTHSTIPFADGQNNVCWEAWYRPVKITELKPYFEE